MPGDPDAPGSGEWWGCDKRGTIDAYMLVGEKIALLARHWTRGNESGWTCETVYVAINPAADMEEVTKDVNFWPEVTSERIAQMLAEGKLTKIDCPFPIPTPMRTCFRKPKSGD